MPEKSALDPERLLDLNLKPYNSQHVALRSFIFELPDHGASLSPVTLLVVMRVWSRRRHAS
jgi:hypothetical protein